jgi:hypothetical protein
VWGALNYGEKQAGWNAIWTVVVPALILLFFILRAMLRCICACFCKAKSAEVVAAKEEKSPEKKQRAKVD